MESRFRPKPASPVEVVFYVPVDGDLEGHDDARKPVWLNPDGGANLSALPSALRARLEKYGVPDELHLGTVFPKEGERFLRCLVASADVYRRFRTET